MRVSIEQDICTSCGACPDYSAKHFYMGDDGIAYVKAAEESEGQGEQLRDGLPKYVGRIVTVEVASGEEGEVIEAAEMCPGECIFVHDDADVGADGLLLDQTSLA